MVLLTVALPVRAGILQSVFSSGENYLTIKIYYFEKVFWKSLPDSPSFPDVSAKRWSVG